MIRASRRDVQLHAATLTVQALHCRAYNRHDWVPTRVERRGANRKLIEACTYCGTTASTEIDAEGYLVGGRKIEDYPKGYLRTTGAGRVGRVDRDGRAAYRLAYVDEIDQSVRRRR